ncbi:recombinase XerD [Blastococcus sp. Marseille-P5729]|uniref:recombinase XerD n=1 Tax=Blastococcus sp. Marseille-P5729 TaxID=2086582 RepID=UPI000D102198|nr:recombinase XerD [Blastococcus sp. Marseille-P5729]
MTDEPLAVSARATQRGRPRNTDGPSTCDRCRRPMRRHRVRWPEGDLCGICYHHATRTHGTCPGCGQERLLPGKDPATGQDLCSDCAGIGVDFHCQRCGLEAEPYRVRTCARCALRHDLTELFPEAAPPPLHDLLERLCASERPESILTWKRSSIVTQLLHQLAAGTTPLTHAGLDSAGAGPDVEHLRSLLIDIGALPPKDPDLARFERWIDTKLDGLAADVEQPVRQFATWHHLKRIRAKCADGSPARGPVHAAKQEITETLKFLTWLNQEHQRTAATCTQLDVDAWLAPGPSTRYGIRTFFVFARKARINTTIRVPHRTPKSSPTLTQQQRLGWINELLHGTSETIPYRTAGGLLLLYAQPITRIANLRLDDVLIHDNETTIRLGARPIPVPAPFDALLHQHLGNRPHQRTGGGQDNPWLFPSTRAGQHLHPNTIMVRLRELGIDLRGARNRAMADLVSELPAPIAAEALGYSQAVAHKHATAAGANWARYAGTRMTTP